MVKVEDGYSATTADLSTALRSGRDDKGKGGASGKSSCWTEAVFITLDGPKPIASPVGSLVAWMVKVEDGYSVTTADLSTALRSGREDKGRAGLPETVVAGWKLFSSHWVDPSL
jgi:hypothetical protein